MILQTLPKKCFLKSFLTSCRPRACNCIKIESPAEVFSFDFSEISQNSLLQNNRGRLLPDVERCYGKKYSRNQ